jgi:DNA-binding NarL/FixJ family response regulator
MIRKVLIAEDQENANISLQKTLQELKIAEPDYTFHCDDALLKIKKAVQSGNSYDLLITDIHFEEDHRQPQLKNGAELIAAARKEQPDLKILVFSAENKPVFIEKLFNDLDIDGYVRKARNDIKDLIKAIDTISTKQRYYPRHLIQQAKQSNAHEFSDFDITIISLMIEGKRQNEISLYLKTNNIHPSGLSSIEKRLSQIKEALNFATNEQLIAHCVKMGII